MLRARSAGQHIATEPFASIGDGLMYCITDGLLAVGDGILGVPLLAVCDGILAVCDYWQWAINVLIIALCIAKD